LWFVGVAYDERDAGEGGDFFGSSLGIAACYEDARGRISGVDFANGVAGLGVGRGCDSTGVENDDVGRRRIGRERAALFAELPLDGRAVCLGGTTAELLDKKGAHRRKAPESYLSIRAHGITATLGGTALYGRVRGLYNFRIP